MRFGSVALAQFSRLIGLALEEELPEAALGRVGLGLSNQSDLIQG